MKSLANLAWAVVCGVVAWFVIKLLFPDFARGITASSAAGSIYADTPFLRPPLIYG
jgi:hypothetical protein